MGDRARPRRSPRLPAPRPRQRPQDAWRLLAEFDELLERCTARAVPAVPTLKEDIMGSGRWSTDVYDAAARYRAATGASAFAYSDSGARKVHPALDPRGVDRAGEPRQRRAPGVARRSPCCST